jgi:hypothetical protein
MDLIIGGKALEQIAVNKVTFANLFIIMPK